MNIVNTMSLNRKLILAIFILWIPSLVQLTQVVIKESEVIDETELQLAGVNYAHALASVTGPIADYRGLADLYINGDRTHMPAISAGADIVDKAFAAVSKLDESVDARLRNGKDLKQLSDDWFALRK